MAPAQLRLEILRVSTMNHTIVVAGKISRARKFGGKRCDIRKLVRVIVLCCEEGLSITEGLARGMMQN